MSFKLLDLLSGASSRRQRENALRKVRSHDSAVTAQNDWLKQNQEMSAAEGRHSEREWQNGAARGFTMIELMVVVAIVGILAAIAVPQYLQYAARSKVTEALSLASSAETAVAEALMDDGGVGAGFDGAVAAVNASYVAPVSKYVQTLTVANTAGANSGTIELTFSTNAGSALSGKTIEVTPFANQHVMGAANPITGSIDWACASAGNSYATNMGLVGMPVGTLPANYAPSNCQ